MARNERAEQAIAANGQPILGILSVARFNWVGVTAIRSFRARLDAWVTHIQDSPISKEKTTPAVTSVGCWLRNAVPGQYEFMTHASDPGHTAI